MSRTVKHFSLHRLGDTELQVISEIELGALPVIEAEETVIRGYSREGPGRTARSACSSWRTCSPSSASWMAEPASRRGTATLDQRPVVNAYDLADLSSCHIFVNWRVMQQENYADDPLAIQGLLAHEHAHPLAENDTTRASRGLQAKLTVQRWPGGLGPAAAPRPDPLLAGPPGRHALRLRAPRGFRQRKDHPQRLRRGAAAPGPRTSPTLSAAWPGASNCATSFGKKWLTAPSPRRPPTSCCWWGTSKTISIWAWSWPPSTAPGARPRPRSWS